MKHLWTLGTALLFAAHPAIADEHKGGNREGIVLSSETSDIVKSSEGVDKTKSGPGAERQQGR